MKLPVLALAACLSLSVPAHAGWASFQDSVPPGGNTGGAFVQLPIGGGGFVTNVVIASDGTQLARTDTAGAFWRSSHTAKWAPVITQATMPSGDYAPGGTPQPGAMNGVCEVAIAPSNTSHFYMLFPPQLTTGVNPAYVYSSTNHGSTWAHASPSLPTNAIPCQPNNQPTPSTRLNGPYMAVSPANENVVYFGTPSSGIWYTLNGGSTWQQIPVTTIPASISPVVLTTSTSSNAVGTGSLTFVTASDFCTSQVLTVGEQLEIYETSAVTNQLQGVIATCSGTSVGITVTTAYGSGTHSDWSISVNPGQGGLVAFDTTDASGNTLYVTAYGTGAYKITSALTSPSVTFLNSSNMPTTFKSLKVDQVGTVWVVDNTVGNGGNLYRYLSGSWVEQIPAPGNPISDVAIDPAVAANVYASEGDGCLHYTTTGQQASPTWVNCPSPSVGVGFSVSSTVIPWLQWVADDFLSLNTLTFDPSQSHALYGGNGDGVFKVTPPTSGSPTLIAWNADETAGIENLDLQASAIPLSGGGLCFAAQDRPMWCTTTPASYMTRYYPNNTEPPVVRLGQTVCGNAAANTYGGINNNDGLSVSTTGPIGSNYTISGQSGLPSGVAGNCIMLTSTNWIWEINSSGLQPYFTNNSGSSWTACTFGGGKTAGGGGWWGIAQDSTSPGTVLLINDGSGATNGSGAKGIWESTSTTSCAFTQVATTLPDPFTIYIKPVPGVACNFVLASQAYIHGGLPGTGNAYLTKNCGVDGGNSAIAGISSIIAWGLGAANPSHDGFPALYFQGWSSGVFGFYEVDNIDGTPIVTNIDIADNGYPGGNFDFIEFIQGDTSTYGTIYGGFNDSGGFYRTLH